MVPAAREAEPRACVPDLGEKSLGAIMGVIRRFGVIGILALFAIGCGGDQKTFTAAGRALGSKDGVAPHSSEPAAPMTAGGAHMADAMAGTDRPVSQGQKLPQSGILTAGSFDDNRD